MYDLLNIFSLFVTTFTQMFVGLNFIKKMFSIKLFNS